MSKLVYILPMVSGMNSEVRNLVRYMTQPLNFGRLVYFFFNRLLFSLYYRYRTPVSQYPAAIRVVLSQALLNRPKADKDIFFRPCQLPPLGRICLWNDVARILNKPNFLAEIQTNKMIPNWRQQFADPEQTMSLHRFAWLLFGLDQSEELDVTKDRQIELVRSWLSQLGSLPSGLAGTPYTTSERIVNLLLFFSDCNSDFQAGRDIPNDISTSLLQMAYNLAEHIEYHGERGTGNHVVNNARALFFVGQRLSVSELSSLAFSILKDALPWLITADGFLREESSHYQLLFTRWLLEINELAQITNFNEVVVYLEPYLSRLQKQCQFFLVANQANQMQIPLIGDVSPDCTPVWLLNYLQVNFALFPETRVANRWQTFPDSGWFRLDYEPVTLFWHIPQSNMIHRATHGHSDVGSFVLFVHGQSVIIDSGRVNYLTNDPLSTYGLSSEAHNTVLIDKLGPFVVDRAQHFPTWYQARTVKTVARETNGQFEFVLTHNGFSRLWGDSIIHERCFLVTSHSLTIIDTINGQGRHTVQTRFHFDPEVVLGCHTEDTYAIEVLQLPEFKGTFSIQSMSGAPKEVLVNAGQERPVISGWTTREYGVKMSSPTMIIKQYLNLPIVQSVKLTW